MPSRNVIKIYQENGYYHIYNRGANKQPIFLDNQDYKVFLSYLKEYLSFRDEDKIHLDLITKNLSYPEKRKKIRQLQRNNYFEQINLLCFGLKENHFHLLIRQENARVISDFMRSFLTRYVGYFNRRHNRIGSLFQDTYKAVLVEMNKQLLHLTRYIHRQTIGYQKNDKFILFSNPTPSSYQDYLGKTNTTWVKTSEVLSFFNEEKKSLSYKYFVEKYEVDDALGRELILE